MTAAEPPVPVWPARERPRERLLRDGASRMSDAELIALCLRTGSAGRSAPVLAQELLTVFGGLRGLLDAPAGRIARVTGVGPAKAATLAAVIELAARYEAAALRRNAALTDTAAVKRYVQLELGGAQREVFAVLFLDSRHRLLAFERLFLGSIDRAHVHPREVLKQCLERNAAAVVLAHNHPSGVAEPSAADLALTDELKQLLQRIDVRLLDHIVVGRSAAVSFAERGLM